MKDNDVNTVDKNLVELVNCTQINPPANSKLFKFSVNEMSHYRMSSTSFLYYPPENYYFIKGTNERVFAMPVGDSKKIVWSHDYDTKIGKYFCASESFEQGLAKKCPGGANAYLRVDIKEQFNSGNDLGGISYFDEQKVRYYNILHNFGKLNHRYIMKIVKEKYEKEQAEVK